MATATSTARQVKHRFRRHDARLVFLHRRRRRRLRRQRIFLLCRFLFLLLLLPRHAFYAKGPHQPLLSPRGTNTRRASRRATPAAAATILTQTNPRSSVRWPSSSTRPLRVTTVSLPRRRARADAITRTLLLMARLRRRHPARRTRTSSDGKSRSSCLRITSLISSRGALRIHGSSRRFTGSARRARVWEGHARRMGSRVVSMGQCIRLYQAMPSRCSRPYQAIPSRRSRLYQAMPSSPPSQCSQPYQAVLSKQSSRTTSGLVLLYRITRPARLS